ncbi:MAG: sulfatase-like hydrolase/transferase [Planctomycetota bacterium]|jgi:arylsulfatase A-like enzyme
MHINKCNRRDFLKITGLSAASLALPGCSRSYLRAEGKNPHSKPNIILILADDQGWHQLGCYGNDFFETPNIDRIAEEGMKFTDAYSAAAVCSPTRASIMTGKYPARLHLTNFIPSSGIGDQRGRLESKKKLLDPIWAGQLHVEEVTVAEALKKAGYTCGHFGKWHLNKDKRYKPGRPGDPASQGFDEVLTTRKAKPTDDPYKDAHHVKQITDRSIEFIREHKDEPFFCYVTHNTIHTANCKIPGQAPGR